ncbi:MAG: hypothetical protein HOP17_04440 [Acidobacteria bacterium]|nr:hypothetical protein [Acidobacteriota bacterium]
MKTDKEAPVTKPTLEEAHIKERNSFKALVLSNANYFGNLKDSKLQAVFPLSGNTNYESLGCLGYQPQQRHLEAVVYLYQPSGYGTGICGAGTPEYVRFYLSYDNGATWQDQGLTSFQAHNIPEGTEGSKRLEYAVSLPITPNRKLCIFNPLIKARAILSWNNPPPANQPNWNPIWGNVRDADILVEPRRFIFPTEIFEVAKTKFPPVLSEFMDLDVPIETKTKVLGAAELAEHYKGTDVPPARFAFKELNAFASGKTSLTAEAFTKLVPGIKIDPNIFDILFPPTDGNISYEELKCIGLDPNHPDTLVGVIQVKKKAGYSGGPCSDGSREYVTFWGDFDGNGSFETCLGTASVRVYDVNVPDAGVYYAVRLPVDLNQYRQACQKGAKVVRIRAIMSWNSPAPCANPNHVPAWGNRQETLISIAPVSGAPAGKIAILGGIPVSMIYDAGAIVSGNPVQGLTTPAAVFATNNLPPDNPDGNILTADGRPCPFAGRVSVQGSPLLGSSYKVEVIPVGGGAPTDVVTKLRLVRDDGSSYDHLANPATGRFDYQIFTQNVNSLLAQWDSTGDDAWIVRLTTYNGAAANPFALQTGSDSHVVQLDNTGPEADIEITSGAGSCGKFGPGDVLSGTFVARDKYLSGYSLGVEPNVNDPGEAIPSPSSGSVNTAVAPGDNWTLDTTGMKPCGYVIRVVASDRAIVNSQGVGHHASDSAGFCLDGKQDD